jgi:hypothetical protein
MHRGLCDAVAALRVVRLDRRIGASRESYFSLISGAAAHDLYHAGQIQLLKKLFPDRAGRDEEGLRAKD